MSESIPIPIHDFGEEPEGPAVDSSASVGTAEHSIAVALAEVAVELVVVATGLVRDVGRREEAGVERPSERVLHAGAGFLIEAIRAAGAGMAALERSANDTATTNTVARGLVDHWEAIWNQRAREVDGSRDTLTDALDTVLDRIDLTALVRRHLDLDAVVTDLDLDPVMARVDMDALLDRMDVDALTARIDVDALVAKIDVKALIERLDLTALAAAVIDELDLVELIRQASAETTSDEVGRLRVRAVDADSAVQRAVDTVLRRRSES
jgi:hypothetical protein